MDAVLLDRSPQRRALAEDVRLADELAERRRSQPLREGCDLACVPVGGVGKEVTHAASMLRRVSAADTWSGASYERIAETFAPIHDRIVEALAVEPGTRFLDVACGTGGVALRAARARADVTGIDISADQLAKARRAAEAEGLAIRFDEGDCQELPYADGEFDVVASAFGAIFAPDHERTAAELARVCRPGGRLALTAWPADHWSETHARAGRTFVEDVDGREWANEEHVRALLGDAFELELQTGEWRVEADSGEELGSSPRRRCRHSGPGSPSRPTKRRAHAERVYLEALASGVLARNYVLVLGTRR